MQWRSDQQVCFALQDILPRVHQGDGTAPCKALHVTWVSAGCSWSHLSMGTYAGHPVVTARAYSGLERMPTVLVEQPHA